MKKGDTWRHHTCNFHIQLPIYVTSGRLNSAPLPMLWKKVPFCRWACSRLEGGTVQH